MKYNTCWPSFVALFDTTPCTDDAEPDLSFFFLTGSWEYLWYGHAHVFVAHMH
jgi:hypothetical protein